MALDPRLLRSFVAVAEDLHFGRAAERLNLAQPALSQQVRRLEKQVGVELLTRDSRHVELTSAGQAMLEPARAAIRASELAERSAQEAAEAAVYSFRLGLEMDLDDAVPTLLAYAEAHPEAHLGLSRMHEPAGHEALRAAQIDAFIGYARPSGEEDLLTAPAINVPLYAAMRPDHQLATHAAVALKDFRRFPIAIFKRSDFRASYNYLTDLLSEGSGAEELNLREVRTVSTSYEAMLREVNLGHAVSFTTPAHLAVAAGHLRFLPFDPPVSIPTFVSWRAERSPVLNGLVDYLRRATQHSERS